MGDRWDDRIASGPALLLPRGTGRGQRSPINSARLKTVEREELARLRKENSELKLDRAFLKEASLFFAQEASDTNVKRSN